MDENDQITYEDTAIYNFDFLAANTIKLFVLLSIFIVVVVYSSFSFYRFVYFRYIV